MANNRLALVNTRTGEQFLLAKYYPSTGWFSREPETLGERLNAWFDKQDFGHLNDEQRAENAAVPGLGVPHVSSGGMYGEEYELRFIG